MKLFAKLRMTDAEQKKCLDYHNEELQVAAFFDREHSLLNRTLDAYWQTMTESALAAGEVCRACDRFRQAVREAVHRHEAIRPIPAAARSLHRIESSYFLRVSTWAEANLDIAETLASGRPPFYVRCDRLKSEAECARRKTQQRYRSFRRRLGLTVHPGEALEDALREHDFADTDLADWQPEPYTPHTSEVEHRIIQPKKDGPKGTVDIMTHNPTPGTDPDMNLNTGGGDKPARTGPPDAAYWYNEGCDLAALARHEEAVSCYDRALEIDPREASAWCNKGVSLAALGRHEEAIACYDQAVEIDPRDAMLWSNKGVNLAALDRHQEAVACFHQATEMDPCDEMAWCGKGINLTALGRCPEAIACWNRALAIDAQCIAAWCGKGVSLATASRHEEAVACFQEALKIDAGIAPVWANLGSSLTTLERHEEAIDCCDKALAIDPRDEAPWYNKGIALAALRRHEEAIACFDQALHIDVRLAAAWSKKGNSLSLLHRPEEAIGCYARAVRIAPRDDAAAWYNKALREQECGRTEEAVRSYQEFIEVATPRHADLVATARRKIEELSVPVASDS